MVAASVMHLVSTGKLFRIKALVAVHGLSGQAMAKDILVAKRLYKEHVVKETQKELFGVTHLCKFQTVALALIISSPLIFIRVLGVGRSP